MTTPPPPDDPEPSPHLYSDYCTSKLGPVFSIVSVNKTAYPHMTKCLALLATLKGRKYTAGQTEKFLLLIPPEDQQSFNRFLITIFRETKPECVANGIVDNLQILFWTELDLENIVFDGCLRECFRRHLSFQEGGGEEQELVASDDRVDAEPGASLTVETAIRLAKDFYLFNMNSTGYVDEKLAGQMERLADGDRRVSLEKLQEHYGQ